MMGLTPRQDKAWRYIAMRMIRGGIAPTLEEIAGHIGVKTRSGAHAVLERLEARGKIRRLRQQARAIEVLEWPPHGPSCPHCGNSLHNWRHAGEVAENVVENARKRLVTRADCAKNKAAPEDVGASTRGLTEAT